MPPRRTHKAAASYRALSPWVRGAFALVAIVQLAVLGVTPWTEVRASKSLGSHIEQPGELHQIHDEDRCASCVMRHLVGDIRRNPDDAPLAVSAHEAPRHPTSLWSPSERIAPDAARAPPLAA
jgi:hypothetical protein